MGQSKLAITDDEGIDTSNPPVVESKEVAVVESASRRGRIDQQHPRYKWVALSNTTLGALLASINASIVLISLPAIFRGIGLNPLAQETFSYLLWMLMGYLVATAVLVVPLGRLGDIFGRVRIYNLGFAIFTIAAIALLFDPFHLGVGAVWLNCWRVIQGIGGAMLMACLAAILTDASRQAARHGAGGQPGRRHRRPVSGSADRRTAVGMGLARSFLGRRTAGRARDGVEFPLAA